MEDKINSLIKAAGVNVDPFWLGLFAKTLANVNIRSLTWSGGAGGPAPAAGAPLHRQEAQAEEKTVEAKKESVICSIKS